MNQNIALRCVATRLLPLPLLVPRIAADYINHTTTSYDFALVADSFNTCSNLHCFGSLVSSDPIWRNV